MSLLLLPDCVSTSVALSGLLLCSGASAFRFRRFGMPPRGVLLPDDAVNSSLSFCDGELVLCGVVSCCAGIDSLRFRRFGMPPLGVLLPDGVGGFEDSCLFLR